MTVNVMHQEALRLGIRALMRAGVPAGHAQTQVEMLIEAELCDRPSHGLLRLPRLVARIGNGVIDPLTEGDAEWRLPSFLRVDGRGGLGPVVAGAALNALCGRARQTGIAIGAIANNNHLGMLSAYVERVARGGQVALAFTTSEALVHPWGGRKAMFGTNPIAIGVPANPHPLVLDMATSIVSMGKIHDHAHRDEPIPDGWALDSGGEPTTDPAAAKLGAIAPFGGAKGYALGLAIEVLVTSLTAAALGTDVTGTLDAERPCNKGDVFIVIDPLSTMVTASISAYLDAVRASPPARAGHPVIVPGDGARARREQRLATGIPMAESVWSDICALSREPKAMARLHAAGPGDA
jgi:L-2-hydroxycarboxylate dehydrogenase (NAD+)